MRTSSLLTTFCSILVSVSPVLAGSSSGPGRDMNEVARERASETKQFALEITNLKVGDRGRVETKKNCVSESICGIQFLSIPGPGKNADILYCYVRPEKILEVVAKVGDDVVASILEASKEECPRVLMTKAEFANLKANFAKEALRLAEQQARINATLGRVRAAQDAWDKIINRTFTK